MALLDEMRVALRVTTTATDTEVQAYMDAARADMLRVGVPEDMLDEDNIDPLAKVAMVQYCKAHFGYDNDEAPRFGESYRQLVADMLNSPSTYGSADE